jgi:hypothetical protein
MTGICPKRRAAMGSSYVSVGDGGPDSIVNTALQVKSAGDDFASKAESLAQAIADIEDSKPWGKDDDYATAFLKVYAAGKTPANDAIRQTLGDSGSSLSKMGADVVEIMAKYTVTDTDNSNAIGSTETTI